MKKYFLELARIWHLKHLIKKDPTNFDNYGELEVIYDKAGKFRKIINLYLKSLNLVSSKKEQAIINHKIALAYYHLGQWENAKIYFEKSTTLISSEEEDSESLDLKGMTYYYLFHLTNNSEIFRKSAIKAFEKLISNFSNYADRALICLHLAELYESVGAYDKAESLCLNLLELAIPDSDKSGIYHSLATIYKHKQVFDKAEKYYEEALKAAKDDKRLFSKIHFELGLLFFSIGKKDKASEEFKQALQFRKFSPWLRYNKDYFKEINEYLRNS